PTANEFGRGRGRGVRCPVRVGSKPSPNHGITNGCPSGRTVKQRTGSGTTLCLSVQSGQGLAQAQGLALIEAETLGYHGCPQSQDGRSVDGNGSGGHVAGEAHGATPSKS